MVGEDRGGFARGGLAETRGVASGIVRLIFIMSMQAKSGEASGVVDDSALELMRIEAEGAEGGDGDLSGLHIVVDNSPARAAIEAAAGDDERDVRILLRKSALFTACQ